MSTKFISFFSLPAFWLAPTAVVLVLMLDTVFPVDAAPGMVELVGAMQRRDLAAIEKIRQETRFFHTFSDSEQAKICEVSLKNDLVVEGDLGQKSVFDQIWGASRFGTNFSSDMLVKIATIAVWKETMDVFEKVWSATRFGSNLESGERKKLCQEILGVVNSDPRKKNLQHDMEGTMASLFEKVLGRAFSTLDLNHKQELCEDCKRYGNKQLFDVVLESVNYRDKKEMPQWEDLSCAREVDPVVVTSSATESSFLVNTPSTAQDSPALLGVEGDRIRTGSLILNPRQAVGITDTASSSSTSKNALVQHMKILHDTAAKEERREHQQQQDELEEDFAALERAICSADVSTVEQRWRRFVDTDCQNDELKNIHMERVQQLRELAQQEFDRCEERVNAERSDMQKRAQEQLRQRQEEQQRWKDEEIKRIEQEHRAKMEALKKQSSLVQSSGLLSASTSSRLGQGFSLSLSSMLSRVQEGQDRAEQVLKENQQKMEKNNEEIQNRAKIYFHLNKLQSC